MQYNVKGNAIEEKMVPSLAGLGDNKLVGRTYMVVIGLFAPDRYKIQSYNGYEIIGSNDHIRFLSVIKNRKGPSNKQFALYFNGATNELKQLPPPQNINNSMKELIKEGTF